MSKFGDLFTPRQLVALFTFSDLVQEAGGKVKANALLAGMTDNNQGLDASGRKLRHMRMLWRCIWHLL